MYHNLKWHDHIKQATIKLRKIICIFKNLSNLLVIKKIKIVYQALVKSIINYGINIWRGGYDTTINSLKIIIILKKNHLYHTEYLYKELYVLLINKFFYKAYSAIYILKNLTACIEHNYNTRKLLNRTVPLMHKKIIQYTYKQGQKDICYHQT